MNDTNEILDTIAKNVKNLRKSKNLTLDDLAEMSDVHKNYLSRLEKGDANISVNKLVSICNALQVHITDVFPSKYSLFNTSISYLENDYIIEALSKIISLHKRNPYFTIDVLESICKLEDGKVKMLEEIFRLSATLNQRDLLLVIQLLSGMNNIEEVESDENE
jgi:transcriptional regulator with XRE-family HTH domain